MSRALRGAVMAVAICVALLLVACGDAAEPVPTPTPTLTPSPTPTVLPTPRPTSTPLPAIEEPAPSGGLTSSLNVLCRVGDYGLEVRVRYGTRIRDTENPEATITRVRVYMDGVLKEDSGPLSHRIYVAEAFFDGQSSRLHTVQLKIDTWAAPRVNDIVQLVPCPPAPDNPVAQVVK